MTHADDPLIPEALVIASRGVEDAMQRHLANPDKIAEAAVRGYIRGVEQWDASPEITARRRQMDRFVLWLAIGIMPGMFSLVGSMVAILVYKDGEAGKLILAYGYIASGVILTAEALFFGSRKLLRLWRKKHASVQ